ncbi:hypothetical protein CDD83_9293 [Cordyceps sp. RAO-2017]|nr:hypothetical protein CDD83_9293 [Cordyceps sp. RAO-2017]
MSSCALRTAAHPEAGPWQRRRPDRLHSIVRPPALPRRGRRQHRGPTRPLAGSSRTLVPPARGGSRDDSRGAPLRRGREGVVSASPTPSARGHGSFGKLHGSRRGMGRGWALRPSTCLGAEPAPPRPGL